MTDKQITLLILTGNATLGYILFKQLGYNKNKIKRLIIKTLWEEYGHMVDKKYPKLKLEFFNANKQGIEFTNKRNRLLYLLECIDYNLSWDYVRKQNHLTSCKIAFRKEY